MTSDQHLGQLILFARHNFDNYQALIRASDAKAGVLVTLMVFLAASSLQVSKDAITKLRWTPCVPLFTSALFVAASVGLALAVIWSLITVQRVLKPRGAAHYVVAQKDRDLMWQDHVLLHQTNQ
jgi:protein-S-isoprenylcysteine O-methyltransferase Ste14